MAKTLVNQTVGYMLAPLHFAVITEDLRISNLELQSMMLTKNAKFLVNFNKNEMYIRDRKKVYV